MTKNQNDAAAVAENKRRNDMDYEMKRKDLDEKKRSNRERENIDKYALGAKYVSAFTPIAKSALNDPSWYRGDPRLVQDVASFSFGKPLGYPVNTGHKNVLITTKSTPRVTSVPGFMVLKFGQSLGSAKEYQNDAVNVAAKQIYSYIRHANSGSANYDAPDLMMYLLAMDSVYMFHGMMCRLYSLSLTTKGENRYYSRAIIKGLGFNPDNLGANLSQLRAYINLFATRANALYVPNIMPYYTRHYWMVSNIFKDQGIRRSSEYLFDPDFYLIFNNGVGKVGEFGSNLIATRLIPVQGNDATPLKDLTYEDIVTFGNTMLNNLFVEEDIGIMSGDILKAFGSNKLYALPSIAENYHIDSVYSQEVLSQITSAVPIGIFEPNQCGFHQTKDGFIYQGGNSQTTDPTYYPGLGINIGTTNSTAVTPSALFNDDFATLQMYKDDVTPDEAMVASRLTAMRTYGTGRINTGTGGTLLCYNSGSDVLGYIRMGYFTDVTENEVTQYQLNIVTVHDGFVVSSQIGDGATPSYYDTMFQTILEYQSQIQCFDWCPRIRLNVGFRIGAAAPQYIFMYYDSIDRSNFYDLTEKDLKSLNSIAIYSLLGVPQLTATKEAKYK